MTDTTEAMAETPDPNEQFTARELADTTAAPDFTFRRMGRIALKALPFMRPMLAHIIVILFLGFLMGFVTTSILTLYQNLLSDKVLVGEKIQPGQAFLLGLDDSYVKQEFVGDEDKAGRDRLALPKTGKGAWDKDSDATEPTIAEADKLTPDQRKRVRNRMYVWLMFMGALGIILGAILRYYGAWTWQNVSQYLRVTMVERLEHLSLGFHSDSRAGDAIYRIFQDSAQIVNLLSQAIIGPIMQMWPLALALAFILAFDQMLFLSIVLAAIPMVWLTVKFTPRIRRRSVANRVANSNLTSRLQEVFSALKVVKASGAENLVLERFDRDSHRALDAALYLRFEMALLSLLVIMIGGAVVIALEYVTAGWVIQKRETLLWGWAAAYIAFELWTLGAFQAASGRIEESFRTGHGLIRLWCMIQDLFIGLERAFYFLDLKPEVLDPDDPVAYPSPITSVTWEDVHFAYKEGQPVLKGVNLQAEVGTVTAIVGSTGCGKSTLMSLLLRLYDPYRGTVRINGVDIRDVTIDDIRTNSAIALQKNVLFTGKVADNIGYAVAGASRQDIERAAETACADPFIREMDGGYDCELGERGSKLSSGQRQRLTIARAVIRNTPILILDEPTASLDAETEHQVLANLAEWGKDKVVFLITHRLSTIRNADQIALLEDGRIAETGSHDELMARSDGRYRRFVLAETLGTDNGGRESS
jgi:ABC-type multidrug transport system fused ATPase/permease subunit